MLPPPSFAVRQGAGEVQATLAELVPREDLVHQPDSFRPGDARGLAGEQKVQRGTQSHQPWQASGTAPAGQDAQLDLRQTDAGAVVVVADPIVAGQRDLGAAAQADPLDRGDRRYRHVGNACEQGLDPARDLHAPFAVPGGRNGGDRSYVGPGDK